MSGNRRVAGLVVLAGFVAMAACSSIAGPERVDDNWHTFDGPRVTFFVRPGSFGEQNVAQLSAAVEDQYSSTVQALALTYTGRVRAYAYNSGADGNLPTDFAGRAYPTTESIRFVAVPPIASLYDVIDHEANHVFIMDSLGRSGTYAMTEGLATALLSDTYTKLGRRQFLYPWTHKNRSLLPHLTGLFDDDQWTKMPGQVGYNASASFLAWLLEAYGQDRLRAIYPAVSADFPARVAAVYGRSLDQLEADWLQFCDSF